MAGYPRPGVDVAADPVREYLLSIPDEVEQARLRGQPVVFVTDREPGPDVRALMDVLGVPVEVRPVTAVAKHSTDREAMLGRAAQDYRASRARVGRLIDAGGSPAVCGDCGTETGLAVVAHSPRCGSYAPPVAAVPDKRGKGAGGKGWETGRDGRRRSVADRNLLGEVTLGAMKRSEEDANDRQPTATSCGLCDWTFTGTALEGREASAAHRADQHPGVGKAKRQRFPKPGQSSAQAGLETGRAALDAMDAGEPQLATYPGQSDASAFAPSDEVAEPEVEAVATPAPARGGKRATWTPEKILDAIRAHAVEHGWPPGADGWVKAAPGRPTTSTVINHFGKWSAAIVAAGFPRPVTGGHASRSAAALSEREPQGHEERTPAPPASYAPGARPPEETVRNGSPGPAGTEPGSRSENADPALDAPTAALIAELLRRCATAIDAGLFHGANLALIFDGLALEVRNRLEAVDG